MEAGANIMYLGLSSLLNRKKSVTFGYIKERLQERLQGWDKRKLSKGGKEILLKSVAQAILNYTMSVFLLPIEVCRDIERIMCKFWWRANPNKAQSIHWMSWERMSCRKSYGGMGFHGIREFNIALLGKQAWRLLVYPEKLVSKVFKARYYPKGTFMTTNIGSSPSYVWRSVFEAQSLIKQGSSCRVGNGQSLPILNVPWLPDVNDPYVHSTSEAIMNEKVSSLMVMGESNWDVDLIHDLFDDRDAALILSIPLNNSTADNWYWKGEKLGIYSVKSAYLILQETSSIGQDDENSGFWRKLWNLKIPPKIKIFLWRSVNNCLPTKDLLRVKQVPVNDICPVYNVGQETILHSLVMCSFAENCWSKAALPVITGNFYSFAEWLELVFSQSSMDTSVISAMLCWMIWKNRNDLVWNQRKYGCIRGVSNGIICP